MNIYVILNKVKNLWTCSRFNNVTDIHQRSFVRLRRTQDDSSGFVAITAVLIIVSVIVAIATTVTLLSVDEGRSGLILYQGEDNLQFVEGCVEDVMLKIRSNASYNGTSITRPEGACTISYISGGPTNWDINVTSTTTAVKRTIRVVFVRNTTGITLTSWQEI